MNKTRRIFALLLVMAMALLFAPAISFAAKLPCGHEDTDSRDHSVAVCDLPGHYKCDGKKHDMVQCMVDYANEILDRLNDPGGVGVSRDTRGDTPQPEPIEPPDPTEPPVSTEPPVPTQPQVPPEKEPPSKPPVEIEAPEDDDDLDVEKTKEMINEAARKGVWIISCEGTDSSPQSGMEGFFTHVVTLEFEAIKTGSAEMFGRYFGNGKWDSSQDSSGFTSAAAGLIQLDLGWAGTIETVRFDLYDVNVLDDDLDDLGSLVPKKDDILDDLGSLVPEGTQPKLIGYGGAIATVNAKETENWHQTPVTSGRIAQNASGAFEVRFYIYVFDSGLVKLFAAVDGYTKCLEYRGRISGKIDGKQVL
ncbi:MAG: hypothetical protein FWE55_01705 [Synergistaceae bacterium]|nr:hypothetical protein [Synergistaceae bacterium]